MPPINLFLVETVIRNRMSLTWVLGDNEAAAPEIAVEVILSGKVVVKIHNHRCIRDFVGGGGVTCTAILDDSAINSVLGAAVLDNLIKFRSWSGWLSNAPSALVLAFLLVTWLRWGYRRYLLIVRRQRSSRLNWLRVSFLVAAFSIL